MYRFNSDKWFKHFKSGNKDDLLRIFITWNNGSCSAVDFFKSHAEEIDNNEWDYIFGEIKKEVGFCGSALAWFLTEAGIDFINYLSDPEKYIEPEYIIKE